MIFQIKTNIPSHFPFSLNIAFFIYYMCYLKNNAALPAFFHSLIALYKFVCKHTKGEGKNCSAHSPASLSWASCMVKLKMLKSA